VIAVAGVEAEVLLQIALGVEVAVLASDQAQVGVAGRLHQHPKGATSHVVRLVHGRVRQPQTPGGIVHEAEAFLQTEWKSSDISISRECTIIKISSVCQSPGLSICPTRRPAVSTGPRQMACLPPAPESWARYNHGSGPDCTTLKFMVRQCSCWK
jgi:hypothetical protein